MLFIDFLILNRDRRGANIEVLLNNRDGSVRIAPLSDQGRSLVCECHNRKELNAFDVMGDHKVQAFIGGSSAFENIRLIPQRHLMKFRSFTDEDLDRVMMGIDKILDVPYVDKIREMIMRRWQFIVND